MWQYGGVPELRGWPSFPAELPEFEPADAPAQPHELFVDWLHDAGAEGLAPHAATLSTVDSDGAPDARVVILKDVDADGYYVASSADSPKGRQLAANPRAALTFFWPHRGRQVRLRGSAIPVEPAQSIADFHARPPASRVEAFIGNQSAVLHDPSELADAAAHAESLLDADPERYPAGWTRYRLRAESIEFWQARNDRRHVRLRYAYTAHGWDRDRLWP